MLDTCLQVLQYFFWSLSQQRYDAMVAYVRQVFAGVSEPELGSPRRFLPLPYLQLRVGVLEADGVDVLPSAGTYCTLEVTESPGVVRTSTAAVPRWNQTFEFTLIDAVRSVLLVTLWRHRTPVVAAGGGVRPRVRALLRRCFKRGGRDEQIGYAILHISDTSNHNDRWYPLRSTVPGQCPTAMVRLILSLTTGRPVQHQRSGGGVEEHVTMAYIFLRHGMNSKTSDCVMWEEALDDEAAAMLDLHGAVRELKPIEKWYCYLQAALCAKARDSECLRSSLVMDLVERIEDRLKMGSEAPNEASVRRLLKYARRRCRN